MLNKVILKGNIGHTPKIEFTQNGRESAIFSLATRISWKNPTREWQPHTDWRRIAVFREPTVKWLKDALKQGDTVYVEGRLTYHQWTDKYSQPRSPLQKNPDHLSLAKNQEQKRVENSPLLQTLSTPPTFETPSSVLNNLSAGGVSVQGNSTFDKEERKADRGGFSAEKTSPKTLSFCSLSPPPLLSTRDDGASTAALHLLLSQHFSEERAVS